MRPYSSTNRRALLFPVGDKLVQRARLKNIAAQDVSSDFMPLLNHANGHILSSSCCLLLQPDCGREAGGAGTNDEDVVLHSLSWGFSGVVF